MAFPKIATNNILPPNRVIKSAFSPKNNQTHMGPSTTSVIDKSANSAAGTTFDPKVYTVNPNPTWNTPRHIAIPASVTEITNGKLRKKHNNPEIQIEKIPAKNTVGSMSSSLPQRRAIVKIENPSADINADKFPSK